MQAHTTEAIYIIASLATAGVILRPFNLAEAVWAVAGAALLVALGLISVPDALAGVAKGTDVYLFLFGMMLLAEIAREEGLFDWLAAAATSHAGGSPRRLFLLTYGVGAVVTIFLSNDATAVVLTPAVAAAVKAAKAKEPLPYLVICAFIANAASFVLPISNPANLVIYGSRMPPLLQWLPAYLLPSCVAIVAIYLLLRFPQRGALKHGIAKEVQRPTLTAAGSRRACHARDPDWRRPRTQSVGDRLARYYPLARRLAPRRTFGRLRRVPENRRGSDAAGSPSCACGRIADAVRPGGS